MNKRGQIQISFGMIISIIIVGVTVAVASYLIYQFLSFKDCSTIGLYYDSLQKQVTSVYRGQGTENYPFSGQVPSSVQYVCFGDLSLSPLLADKARYDYFKENIKSGKNAFLYPQPTSCGASYLNKNIQYITTDQFFCVPVKDGKVGVKLSKGLYDPLVKLTK